MKKRVLILLGFAVVLAGIIIFVTKYQNDEDELASVPKSDLGSATAEEKADYDNAYHEFEKIDTKQISHIALEDKDRISFSKIASDKIAFFGNYPVIYLYNLLDSSKIAELEIEQSYAEMDIASGTFDDSLKLGAASFEDNNEILTANLESKTTDYFDLKQHAYALAFKDTNLYGLFSDKIAKISNGVVTEFASVSSIDQNSLLEPYGDGFIVQDQESISFVSKTKNQPIVSAGEAMFSADGKVAVAYSESETGKNFLALYNEDLQEIFKKELPDPSSAVKIDTASKKIYVSQRRSESLDDKVLVSDFSGNIKELKSPSNKPDFLKFVKVDQIISADGSSFFYNDDGNIYKFEI